MNSALPLTGTAQFLTLVDPYVPDDFINQHWNGRPRRGPHRILSAAQLWRVHLLAVLTPTHSFNQLIALPESHIENVVFEDVRISAVKGMTVRNAGGIQFKNSAISTQQGPPILAENADIGGLEGAKTTPLK